MNPDAALRFTASTSLSEANVITRRMGAVRWRLRPGRLPAVVESVLECPDAFLADPARHLKSGDPRLVTLGLIPTPNGDPPLLLRRLNYGRLLPRLRDLCRRSRVERIFKHGLAMERAGLPTPRVFAAGIERAVRWPVRAYLITEYVPRARTLQDLLATQRSLTREQAGQLVDLVAQLHTAGFFHGDLKATNIIYDERGEPCFIDLDGTRHYQTVPVTFLAMDLERLARNFPVEELARHAKWLLKRYCQRRGLQREFRRLHELAVKRREARLRNKRGLARLNGLLAAFHSAAALHLLGLDLDAVF